MIRISILSSLSLAAFAVSSFGANVTLNLTAEQLKTSGGAPMPLDGVLFLVASTADASFGSVAPGSYNEGDFLGGADDVIIFRGDLTSNGVEGLFSGPITVTLDDADMTPGFVPGLTANDPISVYWFPTADNAGGAGSVALDAGQEGGNYLNAVAIDGSIAWFMPAGGTHDLNFFTADAPNVGGGSNNPADGLAMQGFVVPEPSSLLSLSFGALLLLRRRR